MSKVAALAENEKSRHQKRYSKWKKTVNANNYNENAGNFLSDTRDNSGRIDIVVRGKEKVKWGLELCNDFYF